MRWLLVLAIAGCAGTTTDPGIRALVQVSNAQFVEGSLPAATSDVRVTSIDSLNNTIWAGQINKSLGGRISGAARAVAIGFPDDAGYWIVPAGAIDVNLPDELDWSAKVAFSDQLAPGAHDLQIAAIDGAGHAGPASTLSLSVTSRALDLTNTKLAVSLRWDTEADLDLHVVLPGDPPIIVWSGNLNSYIPPAPGEPVDPAAAAAGGILDDDSNAQCLIDGRREENIVWRGDAAVPPAGHYAVLVDTFSLCAATTAHWTVDVYLHGEPTSVAHAEGTVTEADTRGSHEATSGVRALDFDF